MPVVACNQCGTVVDKSTSHVNRSLKVGYKVYCGLDCFRISMSLKTKKVYGLSYRNRKREEIAGRPAPDKCEVCGGSESKNRNGKSRMHFDHDHKTDRFRGWICGPCNRVLGLVKDDSERLRDLAEYLERHNAIFGEEP